MSEQAVLSEEAQVQVNVDTWLLQLFYHSVVASVVFFVAACWGGGIGNGGVNKRNKFVRKANLL